MKQIHEEDDVVVRYDGLGYIVRSFQEFTGEYPGFCLVSTVNSLQDGGQLPSVLIRVTEVSRQPRSGQLSLHQPSNLGVCGGLALQLDVAQMLFHCDELIQIVSRDLLLEPMQRISREL